MALHSRAWLVLGSFEVWYVGFHFACCCRFVMCESHLRSKIGCLMLRVQQMPSANKNKLNLSKIKCFQQGRLSYEV